MKFRIGHGFDAHPFTSNRPLMLGGVQVPFKYGLDGHSDGDVVIHASIDALLGAAGLGDKGIYFPSSDPDLKGVSSLKLLETVQSLLNQNEWQVSNLDATIVAQTPRLDRSIAEMRSNIASSLRTDYSKINLKATTTDHLGFTGREEGIAAYAVALIEMP